MRSPMTLRIWGRKVTPKLYKNGVAVAPGIFGLQPNRNRSGRVTMDDTLDAHRERSADWWTGGRFR